MNIGLMFINETDVNERQTKQKENDKLISNQLGNRKFFLKIFDMDWWNN